jgi:diguanylate cyclase (GGDEF)-like protein/PAS domain S-box-containing protein
MRQLSKEEKGKQASQDAAMQYLRDHVDDAIDLIQNASTPIHWVSPEGTILWANKAELDMLGYNAEEYIGHNIKEFHVNEETVNGMLAKLANHESLRGQEARLRTKLGEVKQVIINSNALWKDGKLLHTRCFTQDVTERNQAQEELLHAKEQLEIILNGVADAITAQGPDGKIIFANEAAAKLLGYDSAAALEDTSTEAIMRHFEVFDETGKPFPLTNLPGRKALQGHEPPELKVRFKVKGKQETRLSIIRARPVFNSQGKVVLAVNIIKEVTEQQRAEEAVEFLSEASRILSSSIDYEQTLHNIAHCAVPLLGDWSVIYITEEDSVVRRIGVSHNDPEGDQIIKDAEIMPPVIDSGRGVGKVLRTGQPELMPEVPAALIENNITDPQTKKLIKKMGLHSYMCVPLKTNGVTWGALSLVYAKSQRKYTQQHLKLAEELARRAAVAVQNALLYATAEKEITERRKAQQALAASEDRYRRFIEQSTEGIWRAEIEKPMPVDLSVDEQIEWIYKYSYMAECNDAMARMYGFDKAEDLAGKRIEELLIKSDPRNIQYLEAFIVSGYSLADVESVEKDKDGNIKYFSNNLVGILVDDHVVRAWGTQRDVTATKLADQAIEQERKRMERILSSTTEGICGIDEKMECQFINEAAAELFGRTIEECVGKNIDDLMQTDADEDAGTPIAHALRTGNAVRLVEHTIRKGIQSIPVLYSCSPVMKKDQVTGAVVTIVDVSEIKKAEEALRHQALHDALTALPNRKAFEERLSQELSKARATNQMVAVLFVDLDRFKSVNDSLGHTVGDILLKEVAFRLETILCNNGKPVDMVARLGGDEFILLLTDVKSPQELNIVAEKILEEVQQPVTINRNTVRITTSTGITLFPTDADDANTLFKNADTALYKAKAAGRNKYQFYNQDMDAHASERFALENDLREAVRTEQFELYFQPIVHTHSRKPVGVEVLLRWHHPTLGIVYPGEFIPVAEDIGIINVIGEWVLRNACKQRKAWLEQGIDTLTIAVNLSAKQFNDYPLAQKVKDILQETGLPPNLLELEITESIAMDTSKDTLNIIQELSLLGVHFTMDDFGTGYSSLSYLKRFPIENLKIDASFIRDALSNEQDATIVRTILSMAKALHLTTIAEGVEKPEQAQFLLGTGCDCMQGYLIQKPMPAKNCTHWLLSSA